MNVVDFKSKPAMTGITLSFTLTHQSTSGEKMAAQIQLENFARAVHQLQKEGFPNLKHTLISRQEYEP